MHKREFINGTVYYGDCLEVLPLLSTDLVEICVTSPPYNLSKDKTTSSATKTAQGYNKQFENWYFDELEEIEYQSQQKKVITELLRVCSSSVFYNHKVRYAWHSRNKHKTKSRIYHPLDWLCCFPIWCEIIWDRCGISRPTNRFHISDERIYQIAKPKKWNNESGLNNIWKMPPSKNSGHVCSFPSKLVFNCLSTTTHEGDTILDPYLGSGTTALEAIRTGRKFIGIEKDKAFFNLACENIEKAESQQKLRLTF